MPLYRDVVILGSTKSCIRQREKRIRDYWPLRPNRITRPLGVRGVEICLGARRSSHALTER